MSIEPMAKFDPGGKAPIISYNVPDRTAYDGRHIIELALPVFGTDSAGGPASYFNSAAFAPPTDRQQFAGQSIDAIESSVRAAFQTGAFDPKAFPNIATRTNTLRVLAPTSIFGSAEAHSALSPDQSSPSAFLASVGVATSLSSHLANLEPRSVAMRLQAGERLNIYRTLHGSYTYNFIPSPPVEPRPRLLLIETYRLSSFLGNYGAGRTLGTFSLLPGEKTTISVKTYSKTETDAKSASSILDSFSHESSEDFENSVQQEQSDKNASSESFEYHAEADAHASWGWGSANISGGVKGGSNSSREDFAKNVSNALDKHAAKASSKRDVQVNTSYESKQESGVETSTVRELQNINVGRTLNFVFRQMNQEFISILHLVDVRLGFFNGYAESRREVALHDMDSLFDQVLVPNSSLRQQVRDIILGELQTIFDYQDNPQPIVEDRQLGVNSLGVNSSYLRVRKDLKTTVTIGDGQYTVPGVPVRVDSRVMRTEGVIVEALLGQGDALDPYSHGLQDEKVREKVLANDVVDAHAKREALGQSIVANTDAAGAKLFAEVFPCCDQDEPNELVIPTAPAPTPQSA